MSAPAPRELIANYVFTTLTEVWLVEYNELLGTYIDVGGNIFSTTQTRSTMGDSQFRLAQSRAGQFDKYGVPGRIWRQNNRTITGFHYLGAVVAEFNANGVTQANMYSNYDWSLQWNDNYWEAGNYGGDDVHRWNGTNTTANTASTIVSDGVMGNLNGVSFIVSYNGFLVGYTNGDNGTMSAIVSRTGTGTAFGYNRASHVTLYNLNPRDDDTVDFIVVRDEFLAEVTRVTGGTAYIEVYETAGAAATTNRGIIPEAQGIRAGDFIWVVPTRVDFAKSSNDGFGNPTTTWGLAYNTTNFEYGTVSASTPRKPVLDYGVAETVEGTITRVTLPMMAAATEFPQSLTMSGGSTLTTASNHYAGMTTPSNEVGTADAVVYLGTNGFVLGFDTVARNYAALDYLYLRDLRVSALDAGNAVSQEFARANVVFTDGNAANISLQITGSANARRVRLSGSTGVAMTVAAPSAALGSNQFYSYGDVSNGGNAQWHGWYSYTVNNDGTYSLRKVTESGYTSYTRESTAGSPLTFTSRSAGGVNPGFSLGGENWVSNTATVMRAGAVTRTGFSNFVAVPNIGGYVWDHTISAVARYRALAVAGTGPVNNRVAARIYVIDLAGTIATRQLGIVTFGDGVFNTDGSLFTINVAYLDGTTQRMQPLTLPSAMYAPFGLTAMGTIVDWKLVAGSETDEMAAVTGTITGTVIRSNPNHVGIAVNFTDPTNDGVAATNAERSDPNNYEAILDVYYDTTSVVTYDGDAFGQVPAGAIALGRQVTFLPHETVDAVKTAYNADAVYVAMSFWDGAFQNSWFENQRPASSAAAKPFAPPPPPPLGIAELAGTGTSSTHAPWATPTGMVVASGSVPLNATIVGFFDSAFSPIVAPSGSNLSDGTNNYVWKASLNAIDGPYQWTTIIQTTGDPNTYGVFVGASAPTYSVSFTTGENEDVANGITVTAAVAGTNAFAAGDTVTVNLTIVGTATAAETLTVTLSGTGVSGAGTTFTTSQLTVGDGQAEIIMAGGSATLTFAMPTGGHVTDLALTVTSSS